jgi:hypothetical protein
MAVTNQALLEGIDLVQWERAAAGDFEHARDRAQPLLVIRPVGDNLRAALRPRHRQRKLVEAHVGTPRDQVLGLDPRVDVLHVHQAA